MAVDAADATVGGVIADDLRGLGVERIYGNALGSLDVVPTDNADLALLLADVDGRLGAGWGAALISGQILHVSCQPGGAANPVTVPDVEAALAALAPLGTDQTPRTIALHLDFDLDEPLRHGLATAPDPESTIVMTLSASMADLSIVAVVGPGVTRGGYEDDLAEFATRAGIGVFNSWGAKGAFRWDSPFHFGTIGLQQLDVELAGLAEFDVVIASGLDNEELGIADLNSYVVQDVPPWQLGALVADWPRAIRDVGDRPALYGAVAEIVTPMYERSVGPVTPARAALHLSGAGPEGSVVVGDAGIAGFWLARAFPTGVAGSVVVPAIDQPGFAAAAALVCGLGDRPAVGIVDGPPDEATELVLEAAASMGIALSLQAWEEGSTAPDDHVAMCRDGFDSAGGNGVSRVDNVGIAADCLEDLVEALGPITAWQR